MGDLFGLGHGRNELRGADQRDRPAPLAGMIEDRCCQGVHPDQYLTIGGCPALAAHLVDLGAQRLGIGDAEWRKRGQGGCQDAGQKTARTEREGDLAVGGGVQRVLGSWPDAELDLGASLHQRDHGYGIVHQGGNRDGLAGDIAQGRDL